MKCASCKFENPDENKFCGACGSKLENICSHCQSPNPSDFQFCGGCGQKLVETKQTVVPLPLKESERKYVTVLFSDMSGYTTLSEQLNPEEVKAITGEIFGEISSIVSRYDGFIEKYIGDAIMALFGIPKAHEDDPIRAIRAAQDIHEVVSSISPRYENRIGKALSMHTGIQTGLVVTGEVNLERGTHGIVGDTINTAARLSGLAHPGEIVVGHGTYKLSLGHFTFQALEPAMMKGKSEPLQVYRVAGAKETPERVIGISSPIVGRDQELDLLSLQLWRLINGTGGIVTISGEAGIGKSRLMAEFRRTDMAKRVLLLEGRAISVGRSLSFYPIIDILKHWSDIRESDTGSDAHRKLEKAIRLIDPDGYQEAFPFIATLMGMKLVGKHAERMKGIEGEALEKLIFRNTRELIIKGSEVRPTVIYIEDFHWVDDSSFELIKALLRLVEQHRVLFILVFRPGYSDTGELIIKAIEETYSPHWTKIDLEALSEEESNILLTNLLHIKGLPPSMRDQILLRSGGNPLFIEEVVRSLIETGAVVLEKGEYHVTGKIENIVIPHNIHSLIATRIDRLDDSTRNLVRVASVIGRNFYHKILREVASNIEEIDKRLDYLKAIQLIRERQRKEELEYLFKHALAQEAAYHSILLQRRKELHQKVAGSIEKVFKKRIHEFYGMLAYHYGMAEDLDKAEEYMIKAGEEAMKAAASSEAIKYFEEALAIYRSKLGNQASREKIAMLEKNIAYALYNRGEQIKSAEYFTKVLAHYGEVLPKTQVGTVCRCVNGFLQLLLGIYFPVLKWKRIPDNKDREIMELHFDNIKALSSAVPTKFVIEFSCMLPKFTDINTSKINNGYALLAHIAVLFSWPGISRTISKRILDYAIANIDPKDDSSYNMWLLMDFMHHIMIDEFDLSHVVLTSFNQFTEKMLKIGAFFEIVHRSLLLGWFFIEMGNFVKVDDEAGFLGRIALEYEHSQARVYQLLLEVRTLTERGKLRLAVESAHKGAVLTEKSGLRSIYFDFLTMKARAYILLGDLEGSETCFRNQEIIKSDTHFFPYYLSDYFAVRSMHSVSCLEDAILKRDGPRTNQLARESNIWGRKAIKASKKFKRDRVEILRLMGTRSWLLGAHTKALKWWGESVRVGERMKFKPDLSRTYFEIGKRLSDPMSPYKELNGNSATEYLNKAKTMFEEMTMKWDLEQVEALWKMDS